MVALLRSEHEAHCLCIFVFSCAGPDEDKEAPEASCTHCAGLLATFPLQSNSATPLWALEVKFVDKKKAFFDLGEKHTHWDDRVKSHQANNDRQPYNILA